MLQKTAISKRKYQEIHGFPNGNPIKRSTNDRSPSEERISQQKPAESQVFCKENERLLRESGETTENALKLENERLKRDFCSKENAFFQQINAFSREIAEIQRKYRDLQAFVREVVEEKDKVIEKLCAEREFLKENAGFHGKSQALEEELREIRENGKEIAKKMRFFHENRQNYEEFPKKLAENTQNTREINKKSEDLLRSLSFCDFLQRNHAKAEEFGKENKENAEFS